MYRGTWIEDGPSAVDHLMRFWGISNPTTGAKLKSA